jgi:hypothetical protein
MPDASFLSLTGAKVEAEAGQTRLANSVLHLFKAGFAPSPTSTLTNFLDNECDFDGYAAATIVAWADPVLAGAAYLTYAPTQTFSWTHVADDIGNQVGGSFLVTAGGDLYSYTVFDPTRPAQGPDQAVITQPSDLYPAG